MEGPLERVSKNIIIVLLSIGVATELASYIENEYLQSCKGLILHAPYTSIKAMATEMTSFGTIFCYKILI